MAAIGAKLDVPACSKVKKDCLKYKKIYFVEKIEHLILILIIVKFLKFEKKS